ncbi:hypothetical protein CPS_1188 [Colwellia psychrerythraea 34H]|uniref:Uncharacterized protein n=1 Tax=Colwellia psychrerythraea (strain 34H / ATCC BAA-681) TaxID=167879 RepID=Q486T4_COLP3|nr:hypothetical protein CPS_1188 [Colwellia psychrerythraea 34H]
MASSIGNYVATDLIIILFAATLILIPLFYQIF